MIQIFFVKQSWISVDVVFLPKIGRISISSVFHFVNEALKRNITSVYDIEIISDESYQIKWNKFCDDLFSSLM